MVCVRSESNILKLETAGMTLPATKFLAVNDLDKLVLESFSCQAGKACNFC